MSKGAVSLEKGARLVSNSRWNFFAFSLTVLVNFVTIPIVISFIGLDAFGISGLILAIYAPFMLLGTVLGQIMVREFSQSEASDNRVNGAHVFSAGLFLWLAGSILIILILSVVGDPIIRLIVKDAGGADVNWQLGFFVAGLGWAAQQGVLILQATVSSTQQYNAIALATAVSALASATILLICVSKLPTFIGFLVGTSLGFIVSVLVWMFLVVRLLPWLFPMSRFCNLHLSRIVELSRWLGGAHFVSALANQADRYVLGIMAPVSVVGQYSVAMRLQEAVHMGLLKITEVLLPHFAVTSNDSIERRATFFLQVSWIIGLIGVASLAPLIPLSQELITIWVDKESADGGGQILRTLAAAGILGSGVNVYYYFAIGTGRSIRISRLSIAHALFTVLFTIILIKLFGPLAAGAGYLLANLFRLAITLWFTSKHFKTAFTLWTLVLCILPPLIAGVVIAWLWTYATWLQPDGWITLLEAYLTIACSVFIGSVLATSLSKVGRNLIYKAILSLRSNFSRK